ncbi:Eukaryotic-type DNA primase, large subunit family protein [Tritrichomonas foetus]|uniref:Eukaryotic-type DNA primase, large subunit family protein n=1 Tax=Tritrichomonas foetus TaxID=1144522 RepID=A0A1J4JPG8_9EUKA|nr:Eukaryotic-type DNA primase, large subunit family protein [Tritrichomonas foetus]|eukprot:OHT01055.1 Eukaryotic-type DNA primase, large subunit family protein [Tritrichomonas foetus]
MLSSVNARQTKKSEKASDDLFCPIYQEIPEHDFSIDEIVSFAIYRSRFHDSLRDIGESEIEEGERKGRFEEMFKNYFVPLDRIVNTTPAFSKGCPKNLLDTYGQKEIDEFSFYSLMIAAMRNEDSQRSFVHGECTIFKHRLQASKTIQINSIPQEILEQSQINFDDFYDVSQKVFFIPFQIIFPFIDVTRYELKNGYVRLEIKQLISIFVSFYKVYLEKKIALLRRQKVHETDIFKIIVSMFEEKQGAFFARERTNWNTVSLAELDNLAHRSFPPCMYHMYTKLKTSHKLFHMGRLQLGLFLKGIGLSLNDSLKLWREEFSKFGITLDQFDRQYAYNIRYNYGKEGSGKNLSPYSCMGMIRLPSPAPDQTHGCPFMQLKKDDCKQILERMFRDSPKYKGFTAVKEECEALADKGQKHPQIACTLLFNRLHDKPFEETAVRHPCEFFNCSEEQFREKEEKEKK